MPHFIKRDDCIWFTHLSPDLRLVLSRLAESEPVCLKLNGQETVWCRMRNGPHGPTQGIRVTRGDEIWRAVPRGAEFSLELGAGSWATGTASELRAIADRRGEERMTHEQKALAERIAALEARVAELGSFLHSAIGYLSSDPASSLTKSRIILERVLLALYRKTMKKAPPRPMIGDMLVDKGFMANIPRRIAARMNAIRDMSNLGPHGEEVDAADAIRVMRDLIDVLEWYIVHHDPSCQVEGGPTVRQFLEILPQLREKYPSSLRPDITSVRFVQSQDRCYLEITTADRVNDYLVNETSKRTDLAFISGGSGDDDPFFSPARSITENAHRFVSDFDLVSIINCTNLFTHEAATRIDAHWQRYGVVLDSV